MVRQRTQSSLPQDLLEREWLDDAADFLIDQKSGLLPDGQIYPELLMALGTQLINEQQPSRGIRLLQEAVTASPHLIAARNNLAVALLQSKRLEEAATHLKAALEIDPNFQDARLNLARYHLEKNEPQSAASLIAPILAKGYHPKAISLHARILISRGKPPLFFPSSKPLLPENPTTPHPGSTLASSSNNLAKPPRPSALSKKPNNSPLAILSSRPSSGN
ncbi:tetratricopeptide repeat protein [Verrucomicrobiaceae bacterium 227]